MPDDTTTTPRPQQPQGDVRPEPAWQGRDPFAPRASSADSAAHADSAAYAPQAASTTPTAHAAPAAPTMQPAGAAQPAGAMPVQVQVRQGKKKGSALGGFVEFVVVVAVAIALAWFITNFVVKPYEIPSESMEDTIMTGDRVLSERISYLGTTPAQGDIVTFTDVEDPTRVLIKRVVAVAGQQVELKDGSVYVDGAKLSEPYTDDKQSLPLANSHDISYPYTVPEGYIWVMGDNRTNSSDSRYFGAVPIANVTGHAFFRYWPLERIGPLG